MLSIILPTLNEKENIQVYIPNLIKICNSFPFEILVVDDNSPDRTWEVAENFSKLDKRIHCFRRIGEKGLSSAILFGITQAKGDWILCMDADGQHDMEKIPDIYFKAITNQYDLIILSRKLSQNGLGDWSLYRKIISSFAEWLGRTLVGFSVSDPLSGYFCIQRKFVLENIDKLNPKGFKILVEILGKLKPKNILELPYTFQPRTRGKTKLSSFVMVEYLLSLLEIRYGIHFSPYFAKYSIVGILGIFVNLFFQFFFESILPEKKLNFPENLYLKPSLSVILGFEFSLIHNFFLNYYWTFADRKNKIWKAFFIFHLVSIFSFIVQLSVWFYLYTILVESNWQLKPATYLGNIVGILAAFVSNYFLNKNLTWRKFPLS